MAKRSPVAWNVCNMKCLVDTAYNVSGGSASVKSSIGLRIKGTMDGAGFTSTIRTITTDTSAAALKLYRFVLLKKLV